MTKTILVGGYGPGISTAVAERFGAAGFQVALVARNPDRLATGVQALAAQQVRAEAFPTDLGNPEAIRTLLAQVRSKLGPVDVVHWNAYGGGAGDFTSASADELRGIFDLAVVGLVTTVQAALPDLRARQGALLVTNGGFGLLDSNVDAAVVNFNAMGLGVANAAKHKTVRLLAQKLKPDGIYVGEVMVTSMVKGTAFDQGNATLDPAKVADRFWQLYEARNELSVVIG